MWRLRFRSSALCRWRSRRCACSSVFLTRASVCCALSCGALSPRCFCRSCRRRAVVSVSNSNATTSTRSRLLHVGAQYASSDLRLPTWSRRALLLGALLSITSAVLAANHVRGPDHHGAIINMECIGSGRACKAIVTLPNLRLDCMKVDNMQYSPMERWTRKDAGLIHTYMMYPFKYGWARFVSCKHSLKYGSKPLFLRAKYRKHASVPIERYTAKNPPIRLPSARPTPFHTKKRRQTTQIPPHSNSGRSGRRADGADGGGRTRVPATTQGKASARQSHFGKRRRARPARPSPSSCYGWKAGRRTSSKRSALCKGKPPLTAWT